jgi:hypothetical protein
MAACDGDGNIYYHVGRAGSYNDSTILELSHDEDDHQLFRLPTEVSNATSYGAFSVTPSGRVWVAVFSDKGENFVYEFDSKGEIASRVRLDVPEKLLPRLIAVFDTDNLLWKGVYANSAAPVLAGKSYCAAVDAAGRVTKELTSKVTLAPANTKTDSKSLPEGAIAVGSDGNAYLLLPAEVDVISQTGTILRKLPFTKPDPESRAVNLNVSGGLLAITLTRMRQQRIETTLLVLDANTGDIFGYYRPSEELGNNPVCFSRAQGFTFLGRDKSGKISFTTALLR